MEVRNKMIPLKLLSGDSSDSLKSLNLTTEELIENAKLTHN